jgi:hypothetical protein
VLLIDLVLPLVVLGGLTVVIAGTVASLLVFRSMDARPMMINGIAGTALAYLLVAFTPLPTVAAIQFNAVTVYPVWSVALALLVAIGWRIGRTVSGPEPTPAEKEAERARRARVRAAKYRH